MAKTVLGLDLGTNSIGWALIDKENHEILGMGSRIIPMGAELSKFERGQAQTKNAVRRLARGARKLNKRYKQRRNKLIYALEQLNMLPEQIKLIQPFDNPNRIDRVCIKPIKKDQKQLTAFDLIELRVKALNEKISLQELGRVIYLYNQLRGYSGGNSEPDKEDNDEEDNETKKSKVNFSVLTNIISMGEPEKIIFKGKELNKRKIKVEVDDERVDETIIEGETFLDMLKAGESLELQIVITRPKKGENSYFFKLPSKTSWRKKMENLEKELKDKSKAAGREVFISEHLLDVLKENRWAKIRNNVVLRSRYEAEFNAVWQTQLEINDEFCNLSCNRELLTKIVSFIFPERQFEKPETDQSKQSKKELYRKLALENGLKYLVKDQIIFYQRELKDQSHLISNCRFEPTKKVVAKSHPIFQEYKIWEQINKLTINTKNEKGVNKKGEIKYEYIDKPIPISIKEWLFEELQSKKELAFATVFNKVKKDCGLRQNIDFLNGLDAKSKMKGNETKLLLKKSLQKLWGITKLDNLERQIELWDILYNGKGNEYDLNSERTSQVLVFLKKYAANIGDIEEIAVQISKIKFSRAYASLSLKAIENILPLVRAGKYFDGAFSETLKNKIIKLLNENVSDPFEKSAQEYLETNIELLADGGIMNSFATILVYDKHTAVEYSKDTVIKNFEDIKRIKQGELRNPLAEQIVNEALVIVQDIWKQCGMKPGEIWIELARELKNSADKRAKIHTSNQKNQKENGLVKDHLMEYKIEITNANIEKYKLWASQENVQEEYVKQYRDPSKSEIEKMRLWKEQGHLSPYSGKPIRLADLFDKGMYDVDHIIPKSRYFDDSFANKVICETTINKDKGNRTAMEYFEAGSITQSLRSKEVYIEEVNKIFFGAKRKNLLATKVPEDPITRQIKDTQYIAVKVKEELNKIVGNENVKSTTGGVTDYLRHQWGLTDKFKGLLLGRYEDMLKNEKFIENEYDAYSKKMEAQKKEYNEKEILFDETILDKEHFEACFRTNFIQLKRNKLVIKNWSKRIDHRHHAIDALIVACTEQSHIQSLNNLNKELQDWLVKHKDEILPNFEGTPTELLDEIMNLDEVKRKKVTEQLERFRQIPMPWPGFPEQAEKQIDKIIVSQKPKDKLLIQYDGAGQLQIKIRGQLHEGTLYGKEGSGDNKQKNAETYRIPLVKLAGKNFATEKTIDKIVNPYLKTVIVAHLKDYGLRKEDAFSAEGILDLNNKLANKRNSKGELSPHTPISSIKIFYQDPNKKKKNKSEEIVDTLQRLDRGKAYNSSLYVKTGDNYLFAVMEQTNPDKKIKRAFDIITFFDATDYLKTAFNNARDKQKFNKDNSFKEYFEQKHKAKLLFTLKQGDFVYLPRKDEEMIVDNVSIFYEPYWNNTVERSKNIYIVQKFSGNRIYFIKHYIADSVKRGIEFGSQDAYENIDGRSIKDFCWKLNIGRLGNIIKPSI
ncbi:MAG: CRISPR-associated protein Csn1 family [Ferruginibacter sp.]|uniref:type II CRISPR RNA-guided endonuclease Cas9 n=1 Tax=Ferruginibacter sp. TaxID=1940288 RepID=UPI00265A8DBF|nr:type II CRISPR RNA-guided endonuclease Cas9 [Ferruginibacter sp.]MDB5277307.1 CRISPR-associated protein Csn1 family [Ferruginibacter sp.]